MDGISLKQLDDANRGDYVEIVYGESGCLVMHGEFVKLTDKTDIFPQRVMIRRYLESIDGNVGSCVHPRLIKQFRILNKRGEP